MVEIMSGRMGGKDVGGGCPVWVFVSVIFLHGFCPHAVGGLRPPVAPDGASA